jgi:predicted PurR-regulated permease PerM
MENTDNLFSLEDLKDNSAYIYHYIEEHITTIEENLDEIKNAGLTILSQGIIGLRDALLFLILCPIYVFFMLLCKDNIYRFIRGFHPKKEDSNEDVIKKVKKSLFSYLQGLFLVMSISGTLTFIGLHFIGIEYALFLGALTALLTPIPYIGVFISALIPIILALLTKDSIWYAVGVLLVFAIVQFLEAYVFTPKIMGDSVNINPLMIVLGLIIFGSLTGIIGMIMTVPLLAISKVIIDYYPHLKPWKYLLEDEKSA